MAGETVLLHVTNGGLEVHEAVIGDASVQDAWDAAEAAGPDWLAGCHIPGHWAKGRRVPVHIASG